MFLKLNHSILLSQVSMIIDHWRIIFGILLVNFMVLCGVCDAATVTLTWDANSDAQYYEVYRGSASGSASWSSGPIGDVTSYSFDGLENGKTYYFSVKAFNHCGNSSEFSDWISATTAVSVEPEGEVADSGEASSTESEQDMETVLADTDQSDSVVEDEGGAEVEAVIENIHSKSMTLTWDINDDATYYEVYRKAINGEVDWQSGNIGKVTSYKIEGLQEGETYYFSVKAFNDCGNSSDYSQWLAVKIDNASEPVSDDSQIAESEGTSENTDSGIIEDESSIEDAPPPNETIADHEEADVETIEEDEPESSEPVDVVDADVSDTPSEDISVVDDPKIEPEITEPDDVRGDSQDQESAILISESPGEGSNDEFVPQIESAIVDGADGGPTIEILDTRFEHLYWLKNGWNEYNELNGESRVVKGDIDGDGEDELIVGYGPVESDIQIPGGFFQVLDSDYNHLAWGRVQWSDYNTLNGETRPTCGDIDGDGKDEIVIGLGTHGKGYMEVFDYEHGIVNHRSWIQVQWPEYNDMIGIVRPVCGDIDNDGLDEVVAGLGSEFGTAEVPGGNFQVFGFVDNTWRHRLWGAINWPEYTEINGETWPEFGDLDGDGHEELVVGLGFGSDGQIAIFDLLNDAVSPNNWVQIPWSEYNELTGETRPFCGDIDFDGMDEIITAWRNPPGVSDHPTHFQILSGATNNEQWVLKRQAVHSDADIDSLPVKGVLASDDTLIVGMAGIYKSQSLFTESEPKGSVPIENNTAATAGGAGCFVDFLQH